MFTLRSASRLVRPLVSGMKQTQGPAHINRRCLDIETKFFSTTSSKRAEYFQLVHKDTGLVVAGSENGEVILTAKNANSDAQLWTWANKVTTNKQFNLALDFDTRGYDYGIIGYCRLANSNGGDSQAWYYTQPYVHNTFCEKAYLTAARGQEGHWVGVSVYKDPTDQQFTVESVTK